MGSVGKSFRGQVLHACRLAIFAAIILLIHFKLKQNSQSDTEPLELGKQDVAQFYPTATSLGPARSDGTVMVLDKEGNQLGQVLQTSPTSDSIIGFSGPTNTLIAFDQEKKICGTRILASRDTRDHVNQVQTDATFLQSLNGWTRSEVAAAKNIDAVSGATLTSLAIREGIMLRLGGGTQSLKFSDRLSKEAIQPFFPAAVTIEQDNSNPTVWRVFDRRQAKIGTVIQTSPAADNVIGYQGPTNTLVAMNLQGDITGIAIGKSYDNQPYVDYVRNDTYFQSLFTGLQLNELAELDLERAGVEGVSGATMTSRAVAEGLVAAASNHCQLTSRTENKTLWQSWLNVHDLCTAIVILAGVTMGLTSLRSRKRLRVGFQLLVIAYLGLTAGNLLSQAMLVGWAQHGVPWRTAGGLAMLSIAALAMPIVTRRNLYCTHLCPHGAAQQLLKQRWTKQIRLPRATRAFLQLIPALLLAWCLLVGMTSIGFSLVDIEPFDAYIFRIAGGATIAVAIVGLVASVFVPMAYCRYGCPTGALLNYIRFNARADHWTIRDWIAICYLLFAVLLWAQ